MLRMEKEYRGKERKSRMEEERKKKDKEDK